jgi:hypothetical protein
MYAYLKILHKYIDRVQRLYIQGIYVYVFAYRSRGHDCGLPAPAMGGGRDRVGDDAPTEGILKYPRREKAIGGGDDINLIATLQVINKNIFNPGCNTN